MNPEIEIEYDVFISYIQRDEKLAREIYDWLEKYGLNVFWSPKKLKKGVDFPDELGKAVISSQHFILIWSSNTNKSSWVKNEYQIFFDQCHRESPDERRMYILLLESTKIADLPPILRNLNIPESIDDLKEDLISNLLTELRNNCKNLITSKDDKINKLELDLTLERQKTEEARDYYRRSRFWRSIAENGHIHIFTCGRDIPHSPNSMRGFGGRTNIDLWDYRAVLDITHYFSSRFPSTTITIEDPMSKLQKKDFLNAGHLADQIADMRNKLEDKDCIIIGSPDVNDFSEILLAHIHKIDPYEDKHMKRKGFVIIKEKKYTRSSFYWEKGDKESEGIIELLNNNKKEYFNNTHDLNTGIYKMYGILIVANNPFNKARINRKVIILSGFSGVATNAIAKLLTDEDLLPEFYELDKKYINIDKDIEILVGVEFNTEKDFTNRDTRNIIKITFEELIEI